MKITLFIASAFIFTVFSISFFSSCRHDDEYIPPAQGKGDLTSYLANANNHLYVINQQSLYIYQTTANGLTLKTTFDTGYDNKALFISDQNLFVSTSSGLNIYDITQPDNPQLVLRNENLLSCDPVDFINQYLFVALSTGIDCHHSGGNSLQVMDINSAAPKVILKSFATDRPLDITIDGNTLFLCQATLGLQVFDITDVTNFTLIKTYDSIKGIQALADDNILIVTTSTGIDQYDYTDFNDIKLLSHIPVL